MTSVDDMVVLGKAQYEAIIATLPERHAIYANRRIKREMDRDWRKWCGLS